MKSAKAGDIIVVPKLSEHAHGRHAVADRRDRHRPDADARPAVSGRYRGLSTRTTRTSWARSWHAPAENDPTMRIDRSEETHQTVLTAMGDAQVETAARALQGADRRARRRQCRCASRTARPSARLAEAQGRHKKQTGGAGQFGDCWLRLEPNPGAGYEFVDEIVGGKIPRGFIPAVDKGVQDAMAEGFLAGYPMVDIKCAVYDGSVPSGGLQRDGVQDGRAHRLPRRVREGRPGAAGAHGQPWTSTVGRGLRRRRSWATSPRAAAASWAPTPTMPGRDRHHGARALRRGDRLHQGPALHHPRQRLVHPSRLEGYEPAPYDVTKKLVEEYQAEQELTDRSTRPSS